MTADGDDGRMRALMDAVGATDGVARVASLRARGFSRRTIEAAVATRALVRPRNGWVAVPDADPLLVAAARAGVVLTCQTQARRLGLWVLRDDAVHVAAASNRHIGEVRDGGVHVVLQVVQEDVCESDEVAALSGSGQRCGAEVA